MNDTSFIFFSFMAFNLTTGGGWGAYLKCITSLRWYFLAIVLKLDNKKNRKSFEILKPFFFNSKILLSLYFDSVVAPILGVLPIKSYVKKTKRLLLLHGHVQTDIF